MKDIETTVIIKRDNLNVIRLILKSGATLSDHASKSHVLIVCINGKGSFTINHEVHSIAAGVVLEMEPNMMHSVKAETDLEIIVTQMMLHINSLNAS